MEGVLSPDQADAVRVALAVDSPRRVPAGWLVEVGGYVGGGLMLGGVALFLAVSWDTLSRPARTGLLAGFALLFVLAAVVVAGGPAAVRRLAGGATTARRRVVGVLLALASVPAAMAVAVAVGRHEAVYGGAVGFVVALAGLLWLPTVPGVVASAVLSAFTTISFAAELLRAPPLVTGVLLLALGSVWAAVALAGAVAPRWLGAGIGAGLALVGAQQPLAGEGSAPWAYALTAGVAVACFVLYRWQREVVLLVGGVLGVTLAVPEAVADVTNGALGGSVILLVAGAVLVAMSAIGLRIRADSRRGHGPEPGAPTHASAGGA
jgi:hypothetical protein